MPAMCELKLVGIYDWLTAFRGMGAIPGRLLLLPFCKALPRLEEGGRERYLSCTRLRGWGSWLGSLNERTNN